MSQLNIVCGAGHHAELLGGDDEATRRKLVQLADRWLANKTVTQVISGMASGWDQALALAALARGIPLVAAVPDVPNDPDPLRDQILEMASEVHFLPSKELRNQWMVDRSNRVVALWNGSHDDTTHHCIAYARQKGKPVDNLWKKWSGR